MGDHGIVGQAEQQHARDAVGLRGGGFADGPELLRTTTRGAAEPGARRPFIGFRVAIVKN